MNVPYIILAFSSLFILGLIDNSRGPVYPELLKQFSITQSTGSIIFTISSLMAFIVALSSRYWLKTIGSITATKIAILIHFVAVVLMGHAAKSTDGFFLFVFASALFGIGVGILSLSINIIIANATPLENRQKFFAGLHSMYGMASLLAPTAASIVFHFNFSWQNYLMFIGILPLLVFILSFKIPSNHFISSDIIQTKAPMKLSLKLGAMFAFYVSSEVLVSSRLVVYLKQVWNIPLDTASSYLSLFFFLLLGGRLMFAVVKLKYPLLNLLKISVIASIIFYILGMTVDPIFLAMTGMTMSFFFPCGMTWVSSKYASISDSLIATIMTFVGGMIVTMHIAFGTISAWYGMNSSVALGVIALSIVLYILQTEK